MLANITPLILLVCAGANYVLGVITEPQAGYTFKYSCPVDTNSGNPGRVRLAGTIHQYEVYNPGPLSIDSIQLEVTVPNRFTSETEPPEGLNVERVGSVKVTYLPEKAGRYTLCKVIPTGAGTKGHLSPGNCFGIVLTSPFATWSPFTAQARDGGQQCFPAKDELRKSRGMKAWYSMGLIGVPLQFLLGAAFFVWYVELMKRKRADEVKKAKEQGANEAARTVDSVSPSVELPEEFRRAEDDLNEPE